MGWFDDLFGDNEFKADVAEGDGRNSEQSRDAFGRIVAEPVFEAFRKAWKAGAGLFELFGTEPVKIKDPVGPDAPNRRPDVAKVETFLDRTGHLDLAKTEGPTGYYGGRLDQGIRGFQKDNALKVDGLINPEGETLQTMAALLSPREPPSLQAAISPSFAMTDTVSEKSTTMRTLDGRPPLPDRVADWLGRRGASLTTGKTQAASALLPVPDQPRTSAAAEIPSKQLAPETDPSLETSLGYLSPGHLWRTELTLLD